MIYVLSYRALVLSIDSNDSFAAIGHTYILGSTQRSGWPAEVHLPHTIQHGYVIPDMAITINILSTFRVMMKSTAKQLTTILGYFIPISFGTSNSYLFYIIYRAFSKLN